MPELTLEEQKKRVGVLISFWESELSNFQYLMVGATKILVGETIEALKRLKEMEEK